MKREILFEVNRYREIMGLSLLSEAPGGPGISLLPVGNATMALSTLSDDIAMYLKDSNKLIALAPDSPVFSKYPVLQDIRDAIASKQTSLGRPLETSDIPNLKQIEDIPLNFFKIETPENEILRNTFIQEYVGAAGLDKFKTRVSIEKQFKEAAKSGLKDLTGLTSKLIDEIENLPNLPDYIKDYVTGEIYVVSVPINFPDLLNKKFGTAIIKSYDDLITTMSNKSGIGVGTLKKYISKDMTKSLKEKLIKNNGDINLTITEFTENLNNIAQKIAEKEGISKFDVFKRAIDNSGDVVSSLLSLGPLKGGWEKIANGQPLKGASQIIVVLLLLVIGTSFVTYWKEAAEYLGFNELSSEESDLEKKFPNIDKTNKFWKEVYAKIKSTGKVGEIIRTNATATEEETETKFFGENTYKVTFNFGDYGIMDFFTDNEGEKVSYNTGTGVFPKDKYDVPDVPNVPDVPTQQSMTPPTADEFKKWFESEYKTDYPEYVTAVNASSPTVSGNDVTVTVNDNSATFTKTANGVFVKKQS